MADLRRERDTARRERDQLRQELADLRSVTGDIDAEYAAAYRDLCDLATQGVRRPADLGTTISSFAASQSPNYNKRAAALVAAEKRHQRKRARDMVDRFHHLVDGKWAEEAPEYRRADVS